MIRTRPDQPRCKACGRFHAHRHPCHTMKPGPDLVAIAERRDRIDARIAAMYEGVRA